MTYNNFEIDRMLDAMTILIDTREQATEALQQRIDTMQAPIKREKLDYGDYSAEYVVPNGSVHNLCKIAVIERKMSIDELCICFTKERERFEKEFERAECERMYLLIEGATWEKVLGGKYRSKYPPAALVASMWAWSIRYNIHFVFCKADTTGKLIKEILYRELKEHLSTIKIES